ncbi:ABC-type transport auxiliary lipoprotein family protein [Sulfitobacter sp. F26204]|uniref:PqiC family protein n=1 Tax=Sulfitobacter sp. F26204 TaxID=2996014 RepID=UPI00225E5DDA|nr:ABC-type transport auxiliary lipoprotein family protein [Sulfitobacter sp. F26204]MCX7558165.1 ABC-type transport auxiliary lipoprotein family protein [Sulfitobacter sp. F26204]
MKFTKRAFLCLLPLALAACGAPDRFAVKAPEISQSMSIAFASVEVRDVSLPSYAAADEISLRNAEGTLISSSGVLWADAPDRAIALELSRNLSRLTGRRIASEPWPFEAFPDARLEIRFAELIATTDGSFETSGQYFVAVSDGRRERSGLFDLSVQFDPKGGPNAIAQARGQLILDLAAFVAKNGLK